MKRLLRKHYLYCGALAALCSLVSCAEKDEPKLTIRFVLDDNGRIGVRTGSGPWSKDDTADFSHLMGGVVEGDTSQHRSSEVIKEYDDGREVVVFRARAINDDPGQGAAIADYSVVVKEDPLRMESGPTIYIVDLETGKSLALPITLQPGEYKFRIIWRGGAKSYPKEDVKDTRPDW